MKKYSLILLLTVILVICTSACIPVTPSAQGAVSEAYIQTAVASTLTAEKALAAGAALSFTETPSDGTSTTPSVDETVDPDITLDPEPTLENPWMLQNWCVDHPVGCVKYDLKNTTDSWLQIELKETDTGVTGFFTVRSKTTGQITLIPGQYTVKYTWKCDGEAHGFTDVKSVGAWVDVFSCPLGFDKTIPK